MLSRGAIILHLTLLGQKQLLGRTLARKIVKLKATGIGPGCRRAAHRLGTPQLRPIGRVEVAHAAARLAGGK